MVCRAALAHTNCAAKKAKQSNTEMSDRCQTRNVGSLELIQWQLARFKIAWPFTQSRSHPESHIRCIDPRCTGKVSKASRVVKEFIAKRNC